jgi:hypothetical protein
MSCIVVFRIKISIRITKKKYVFVFQFFFFDSLTLKLLGLYVNLVGHYYLSALLLLIKFNYAKSHTQFA